MSLKIDGNLPTGSTGDAEATQRVTGPRLGDRAALVRPAAQEDRVEVSRDAQLVTTALKAADETSAIRHDVVERMRRLLESGDLGKDATKLADAMLERLLDRS